METSEEVQLIESDRCQAIYSTLEHSPKFSAKDNFCATKMDFNAIKIVSVKLNGH